MFTRISCSHQQAGIDKNNIREKWPILLSMPKRSSKLKAMDVNISGFYELGGLLLNKDWIKIYIYIYMLVCVPHCAVNCKIQRVNANNGK